MVELEEEGLPMEEKGYSFRKQNQITKLSDLKSKNKKKETVVLVG